MKPVLGGLNKVRLDELMRQAAAFTTSVEVAVAYASDSALFDHSWIANIPLTFYGLLDKDTPVSIPILQKFLDRGSERARCFLVRVFFHSKVIWWHGFGVYIGSANLTQAAWWKNVEAGVFIPEDELAGTETEIALESL